MLVQIWEEAVTLPRQQGIFFSRIARALSWVAIPLLIVTCAIASEPTRTPGKIVCREQLSVDRRANLASKLRRITGWRTLQFNDLGVLEFGSGPPENGSQTARDLIQKIIHSANFVVLEDASNRSDVVFCRVVDAKWKNSAASTPAHVILIDFSDFEQVMGDRQALAAFDVGWALLHEFEHIADDSEDAHHPGETGECEARINEMRRECHLPERAEYFFSVIPSTGHNDFKTKYVRLAFVEQVAKHKKHYWVFWDADLVGGLQEIKQIAAAR